VFFSSLLELEPCALDKLKIANELNSLTNLTIKKSIRKDPRSYKNESGSTKITLSAAKQKKIATSQNTCCNITETPYVKTEK
jgi:hypothetical protein